MTDAPHQRPVDFGTFVLSLGSSALVHLGEIHHPETAEAKENLLLARQVIDLLAMLEEKTRGNLTPEEARFLSDLLADLRLKFVEKSRGAAPRSRPRASPGGYRPASTSDSASRRISSRRSTRRVRASASGSRDGRRVRRAAASTTQAIRRGSSRAGSRRRRFRKNPIPRWSRTRWSDRRASAVRVRSTMFSTHRSLGSIAEVDPISGPASSKLDSPDEPVRDQASARTRIGLVRDRGQHARAGESLDLGGVVRLGGIGGRRGPVEHHAGRRRGPGRAAPRR